MPGKKTAGERKHESSQISLFSNKPKTLKELLGYLVLLASLKQLQMPS